jgi:phytol kinase
MLHNDWLALIITFIVALAWLRLMDFAAHRGWISSDLSRKIIHIGTGPLFVLCWLLFTDSPDAPYMAALVPGAITLQFFMVGSGVIKDEAAVQAMSRSGDRREILRGPLYYGLVFVVMTILYWRQSPTGMVTLMLICGGDGLADVVGRRMGKACLPWNKSKSWSGSLAMFAGGWVFALAILAVYVAAGRIPGPFLSYIPGVTLISLAATVVESLPLSDLDNLTIAMTGVLLGPWLL